VDTGSTEQADLFPDDAPEFAIMYWRARDRWFETTRRSPRREELHRVYNRIVPPAEQIALRTFDRRREQSKRWLGSWPPKFDERPAWEHTLKLTADDGPFNVVPGEFHHLARARTAVVDESGRPAIRVDEYDTTDGRVIHSYIDLHGVIAATLVAAFGALDLMVDGRADGVIQVCHLLGKVVSIV
jgi:hypothetical protein